MNEPERSPAAPGDPRAVRNTADGYVRRVAELNPLMATVLGVPVGEDLLPDLSPGGRTALDELSRSTLSELDEVTSAAERAGGLSADERRCARLLRERLEADLATSVDDEYLREVMNVFGLQERLQAIFELMPTSSPADWAAAARRMSRVRDAVADQRQTLDDCASRGTFMAAPRQIRAVADQLGSWLAAAGGRGWFSEFADDADVPPSLRSELDKAASAAADAVADFRDWLLTGYLVRADRVPDGVGAERYRTWARLWTGADLDLADTYEWGWSACQELARQMRAEADQVLPGSTPLQAMRHLDEHGEAVEGVQEIRQRLQQVMDEAISELDGTHFDVPAPVRVVEVRIAPAGAAAAAYYTPPDQDFSRPGRIWFPTMGKSRFPLWSVLSMCYHEGVPGHHLQLAQWICEPERLCAYQRSIGKIDACTEGWAMYAERLMAELGYLRTPADLLGLLDRQMLQTIRVVVDIGMHLELAIPGGSPVGAGQKWTPELAREFIAAHVGRSPDFVGSEVDRYLGLPGQALAYKLGERAWLAGRDAAAAARRGGFDLKSWHAAALPLGSLGLDDLADELSRL